MDDKKVQTTSENLTNKHLEKLRKVFPQFVKENVIDFDALQSFFKDEGMLAGSEKYGLNWAGKSNAFKLIQTPSVGTLKPQEKESVDWAKTQNLFIEGDNLEVLKLLQKQYREKIKMIYIDPPYNTGKDFIYKDNYTEDRSDYYERTGQTENGIKLTSNPESNGRYHSDWLTMMYPRLFLARNLLKENGVIFISIDDNEIANLRLIMDEIFGEENFIDCIIWKKRYGGGSKEKYLVTVHEYVLFYAKNIESIKNIEVTLSEISIKRYYKKRDKNYELRGPYRTHPLEAGRAMEDRRNLIFPIIAPNGKEVVPRRQWLWSKETVEDALKNDEIEFSMVNGEWIVSSKQYLKDRNGIVRKTKEFSLLDDIYTQHGTNEIISYFGDARIFPYPKPVEFIKRLLRIGTDEKSLILDYFAGSSTTADAVMDLNTEDSGNRRWILVQLPEETEAESEARKAGYKHISGIAKERIRRAAKKIVEEKKEEFQKGENPLDTGFKVLRLTKSNYRQWQKLTTADDIEVVKEQMKLWVEKPLADTYDEKGVVYEVLLKEGYDLNSIVTQNEKGKLPVWEVQDGKKKLVVTFAKEVTLEQVQALFVCLDSSLNDSSKLNIARRVNLKAI